MYKIGNTSHPLSDSGGGGGGGYMYTRPSISCRGGILYIDLLQRDAYRRHTRDIQERYGNTKISVQEKCRRHNKYTVDALDKHHGNIQEKCTKETQNREVRCISVFLVFILPDFICSFFYFYFVQWVISFIHIV